MGQLGCKIQIRESLLGLLKEKAIDDPYTLKYNASLIQVLLLRVNT